MNREFIHEFNCNMAGEFAKIRRLAQGLPPTDAVDAPAGLRHPAAMTITAKVHNHTITLPPELVIAEGAEVQITVPEAQTADAATPGNALAWMEKYAGRIDGPEDFAAEHDHYIHGTPKRAGR